MEQTEWILCPICGSKTRDRLREDTSEIISIDTYGDNRNIIADEIPELENFIQEVMPELEDDEIREEVLNAVVDPTEYLLD